ncbi:MAG: acyl-CoA dehydrogenase family protein [Bacteroidales bacterium]
MSTTTPMMVSRGGAWLVETTEPDAVFTPEKLSEEHRMIARTAEQFVKNEVLPNLEKLEQKDWALARQLIAKGGELDLIGVDVPETYGGAQMDKTATVVLNERMAWSASFAASFGAHSNLSVLPLLLFGTDEQKNKYLPRLIKGEIVGAYALSESGSGSDALGAKAKATRQPDGSWLLNGEKMWITNGGFADLFIVFAKVDGQQFTAFLVERAFPGVSSGKEEHKMGLHGSSTTPLLLQEARVPAENVLGEIGKGHKVAFNVLNFGRYKLGAMCSGGSKNSIGEAAKYAATRKQFGQPIANFGAIKFKLGEMTLREYAVESLVYRTAGLIDQMLADHDPNDAQAVLAAVEEFARGAALAQGAGRATRQFVLDENVQIHGGNGFVSDYPAERHYRDARVNRIFEGTNEINRLLIPGMFIRRALKNELPIIPAAKKLMDELMSPAAALPATSGGVLDEEARAVASFKKVALMILGTAMQKYGEKLTDEQEVLTVAADILIDTYCAESAVLRAMDAKQRSLANAGLQVETARAFVSEAGGRIEQEARSGLAAMAEGDMLRTQLAALRRLLKLTPINTVAIRRRLADETVARGAYIFG